MLVSGVQQSYVVIYIYIYIIFHILSFMVYHRILNIIPVLCSRIVGHCCLFILYVVVCIC